MTFWGVDLWAAALLFARFGTMMMLMPGFGEAPVFPRLRLALALMTTICLAPLLGPLMPDAPTNVIAAAGMLTGEIMMGLIVGGAARMLMASLSTAGQILGLESGLSFAQTTDPTNAQVSQSIAVFLGMMGVALVFASDLHHEFLRGMVGTYQLFTPGHAVPIDDAAALAVRTMSDGFRVAFQIAAPLLVAGFLFRLGLGALSRLIPSIQVFFVALPLQTLGSFVIIALGLSAGMLVWLESLGGFAQDLQ